MEDDVVEVVLEPSSFTGPERRIVQQHLKVPFGDLLVCAREAVYRLFEEDPGEPQVLVAVGGALVFPDEVMQTMAWVQALRSDPEAKLEDFDHLTMSDLNTAMAKGMRRGKASTGGSSTTSSPESPSADSSPA